MGLGGLWHGASWNFVVWGLYHGALLVLHRLFSKMSAGTKFAEIWDWPLLTPVHVAITFLLVNIGWILFRAPDFHASLITAKALFAFSQMHFTAAALFQPPGVLLLICLIWCLADPRRKLQYLLFEEGVLRFPVAFAACLFIIEVFAKTDVAVPFIYFRF